MSLLFRSLARHEMKSEAFFRSLTTLGMTDGVFIFKSRRRMFADFLCVSDGGCYDGCYRRGVRIRIVVMVVDGFYLVDCCHSERSEETG